MRNDAEIQSSGRKRKPAVQGRIAWQSDGTIVTKLKRKAAFFEPTDGKRGVGMLFFDLAEPSQIIEVVEPFFLNYNAEVHILPAMTGDDLRKGLAKAGAK